MKVNPGSGAPDSADGVQAGDRESADNQPKSVQYEDYKRTADDMHKYKKQASEYEKRLKDLEEQKLKESNDWKTLAEQKAKEASEWKGKYENQGNAFVTTQKFSAVQAAALKAGLRPEAEADLELLELAGVEVELTNTGKFRVENADQFVQSLKKSKPHWFKDETVPPFNPGGGGKPPAGAELTTDYMVELRTKDPKKFRELFPKYQAQQAKK